MGTTDIGSARGADPATSSFPSYEVNASPYGFYERLRGQGRVFQLPGTDEYVITHHEDVAFVARNTRVFSNRSSIYDDGRQRRARLVDLVPDAPAGIINSDGEQHAAKRKLAFALFRPGKLRAYEEMIGGHVDALIDGFIARGEVELVSEFCAPLPAYVIFTILGLPYEDIPRALGWAAYEGAGTRFTPPDRQAAAGESIKGLIGYVHEQLIHRQRQRTDDELTRFMESHIEHDGELDLPNVLSDSMNIMVGGLITTSHLLSSMMLRLLQNPAQMQLLREDPALIPRAIEEALRMDAPVQWSPRIVLSDTEIGGVPIAAGSIVLIVFASGGRDAQVFDDADRFDVRRSNVKDHLSFGHGPHFCLGAPLARLEVRIAIERLLARLEGVRLARARVPERHEGTVFYGLDRLPLEFTPVVTTR